MEFIMNQKMLEQLKKQGLNSIDADHLAKIMLEKGALDQEPASQPESTALGSLLRAADRMLTEVEVNVKLFTASSSVTAAMNIRAAAVMDCQGKKEFFEQLDALYTRQDNLMCLLLPIYALLDTKEKMLFDEGEDEDQ